jgi:hypothetical protein
LTKKNRKQIGASMNKLVEIFCDVDDKVNDTVREGTLGYFCKVFIPQWEKQCIEDGTRKRKRACRMPMSEIMTIVIAFHTSFKLFLYVEGRANRH